MKTARSSFESVLLVDVVAVRAMFVPGNTYRVKLEWPYRLGVTQGEMQPPTFRGVND
jgi:hypothetical protein